MPILPTARFGLGYRCNDTALADLGGDGVGTETVIADGKRAS
jgi:hypothetical protein